MNPATDVNQIIADLIDGWCEQRALKPLGIVLPHWPHNGLTDCVAELLEALREARALARDQITESELAPLNEAIGLYSQALNNR